MKKTRSSHVSRIATSVVLFFAITGTVSAQFLDPRLSLNLGGGVGFLADSEYLEEPPRELDFRLAIDADALYILGARRMLGVGASYRRISPYEGLTVSAVGATGALLLRSDSSNTDVTTQIQLTYGLASMEDTLDEANPQTGSGLLTDIKTNIYFPMFPILDLGTTGTVILAPGTWFGATVVLGGILDAEAIQTDIVTPLTDTIIMVSTGFSVTFILAD